MIAEAIQKIRELAEFGRKPCTFPLPDKNRYGIADADGRTVIKDLPRLVSFNFSRLVDLLSWLKSADSGRENPDAGKLVLINTKDGVITGLSNREDLFAPTGSVSLQHHQSFAFLQLHDSLGRCLSYKELVRAARFVLGCSPETVSQISSILVSKKDSGDFSVQPMGESIKKEVHRSAMALPEKITTVVQVYDFSDFHEVNVGLWFDFDSGTFELFPDSTDMYQALSKEELIMEKFCGEFGIAFVRGSVRSGWPKE